MTASVFSSGQAAAILFGAFFFLLVLRVPVAFALGLACRRCSTSSRGLAR